MLPPDAPYSPWVLAAVLLALVGGLAWRALRGGRTRYRRFARLRGTAKRQRTYRRWLLESLLVMGGGSLAVLALAHPYVPLLRDQVESNPVVQHLRAGFAASGAVGPNVVAAVLLLLIGVTVGGVLAVRQEDVEGGIPSVGDISALLPRNRAELRYGALLSVNAGVVEELMFRLAVPALVFGVTGNAIVAIVVALALFGALHIYQGVAGVIGSTVIGALLMGVYLATGSIAWAMLLHALIDLRSLVLIPAVVLRVHRVAPGRPARERTTTPPPLDT